MATAIRRAPSRASSLAADRQQELVAG